MDPAIAHQTQLGTLYRQDAVERLKLLDSESVDLVVADPPYGGNAVHWDRFGSLDEYVTWCEEWMAECSRVLKSHGSAYICGWSENLAYLKVTGDRHFPHCRWLVWYYRNKHAPWKTDWGRAHESILHFRKQKKHRFNQDAVRVPYNSHTTRYPSHKQGHSSVLGSKNDEGEPHVWQPHPAGAKPKDVFEISTINNGMAESTPHPTQKPEELIRRLVMACTEPGDLVVDPFGGSGTTFVVAEKLERRWLGTEIETEYIEYAMERLARVVPDEAHHLAVYDAVAEASVKNQALVRNGRQTKAGSDQTSLPVEDDLPEVA